jgi:hypothetical protein
MGCGCLPKTKSDGTKPSEPFHGMQVVLTFLRLERRKNQKEKGKKKFRALGNLRCYDWTRQLHFAVLSSLKKEEEKCQQWV